MHTQTMSVLVTLISAEHEKAGADPTVKGKFSFFTSHHLQAEIRKVFIGHFQINLYFT